MALTVSVPFVLWFTPIVQPMKPALGAAVEQRGLVDQLRREPGDLRDALGRVLARPTRAASSKPVVWRVDVVAIDQVVLDQDVDRGR